MVYSFKPAPTYLTNHLLWLRVCCLLNRREEEEEDTEWGVILKRKKWVAQKRREDVETGEG